MPHPDKAWRSDPECRIYKLYRGAEMKEGTESKHTNRVTAKMDVDMSSESQRKAVKEAIEVMKVPKGASGSGGEGRSVQKDETDPEKKAKKEERLPFCFLLFCEEAKRKKSMQMDIAERLGDVLISVYRSKSKGPILGWQDAKRGQRPEEGPWHGGPGIALN